MKHATHARRAIRLAGRISAGALAALVILLVFIQFTRAIGENVAMARELASLRSDVTALEVRRDHQRRELQRLEETDGAIPEIHDRLRMVRPNEAIIFVSPLPSPAP